MRGAFEFFDTICCINLDRRPERWAAAQREFAALGIADRVQRVAAMTHDNPLEACRRSHLGCVQRAARAGAETVLIFEDDVTFPDFSAERFARSLDRLRSIPDWDLFFLGGLVRGRPAVLYEDLFRAPLAQMHAYAVHRRAFDAIQAARLPFDVWCSERLRSYCARPMLAWQRDGPSDLAGRWTSRATEARRAYDLFVGTPYGAYLLRRGWRGARRGLGHVLVWGATRLGVRLRFEDGRPRVDGPSRR